MKIICDPQTDTVTVDGEVLLLGPSLDVCNHSPTGFAWGYGGSGPAQLALAILLYAGVPKERAVGLYQQFKWDHVANWGPWPQRVEVSVDVPGWVSAQSHE